MGISGKSGGKFWGWDADGSLWKSLGKSMIQIYDFSVTVFSVDIKVCPTRDFNYFRL